MPTDFESAVFEKTKEIPHGKVTTYGEIARALKRPGSARAVGNALNKNPSPIIVPCHRVVRSDGSIGGYAFGVEMKIELLTGEGVIIKDNRVLDDLWHF